MSADSSSIQRRHFDGNEKLAILREHLLEHVPISKVCDKYGIQPTLFYQWQKKLFEEGASVFDNNGRSAGRQQAAEAKRVEFLEARIRRKDEVLAELMGEHIALKKSLGEI